MPASIKLNFLKNELKRRDPKVSKTMLKEAREAVEKSIFIDVDQSVDDLVPASMSFMKKDIRNIAYSYTMALPDETDTYKVIAVLNKEHDKLIMHIYLRVSKFKDMFPLLGRFVVDSDYSVNYKDAGYLATSDHVKIAEARKEMAHKVLNTVFALLDYDYALRDNLTRLSTIAKLRNKDSYNNYVLTTRAITEDVKIINTIEYMYEGSKLNLEPAMLEELPFHNFYLKIGFNDDAIQPIWTMFDHGKLHAIMCLNERSSKFSIGYVDINDAKFGSPINVNINKVKDFRGKEGFDIQDVAHMLNVCCRAFIEFMYKFNRLVPYSENVSKSFTEHVVHVVNNTSVHKIVILNPESKKRSTQGHRGGRHASPREHVRIGHKRVYKSGKEIWVDEITVNEGKQGKITKTYKFAG